MARLGISLYPEHSTLDKEKAYVTLAAKYGFKRIFTCLLSVDKEREEILAEFRELIDHAHSYGMEVILDVAPFVFEKLHVSYDDLSFFAEMHADGIRLDEGFDSLKEALMTYNPQNLKIEINASLGTKYLDNISAIWRVSSLCVHSVRSSSTIPAVRKSVHMMALRTASPFLSRNTVVCICPVTPITETSCGLHLAKIS